MPTVKGLLEVSIQGLLGQWVRLEACPCPDQATGASPLLLPSGTTTTHPPIPAHATLPLGCPLSQAMTMWGQQCPGRDSTQRLCGGPVSHQAACFGEAPCGSPDWPWALVLWTVEGG